jgi:nucleoid DNA-binding protein
MATIKDIAKALVAKHQLKQADAEEFLQQIVEVINEGLLQDRQVKIKGFGTFKLQVVKERSSVNVNTGERVTIGEHSKITFTPDALMRDTINKPFAQFETTVIEDGNPLLEEMPAESESDDEEAEVEEAPKAEEPAKVAEPVKEEPKAEVKPEPVKEEPKAEVEEAPKAEEPAKVAEPVKEEPKAEVKPEPVKEEPKPEPKPAAKSEAKSNAEVIKFVEEKPAETIKFTEDDQPEEHAPAGESFFAKNKKMLLICCGVAALLLCIILLSKSGAFESEPEPVVVEQKDTVAAEPVAEEINLDVCNQDPRVSTGAYKIVGVQAEVIVKEGQTLSKISQDYFGPGMVCYLEAMNQTKVVNPGDKIKIPQLEAKKNINKKKRKSRRSSRSQEQEAAPVAGAE